MQKWFNDRNELTVELSSQIDTNIDVLNELFDNCGDVVQKSFYIVVDGETIKIHLIYIDGIADNSMIEQTIIKPLSYEWCQNGYQTNKPYISYDGDRKEELWSRLLYVETQTVDIKEETSFDKIVESVLKGDTALFVDGFDKTMIISSKKFPLRSISENETEAGIRGPKDSFNEGFRQSTALIRRRIRDAKLKVEQGTLGLRSKTDYAIMYMEDLAEPKLIDNIRKRLNKYDIDAIFDSGMAEHLLEEKWYSPFPIFQSTTRPDKVAAGIVEGRVAIVFDNSPEVIMAPCNFNMLLQASDDYYSRWAVGTFARLIRYIAAFIAITLPGFYIAITIYHSDMLPTRLLYAIASARSMVTFPIVVEILIMEFLFELLREAGIRLPGPLGNTIGVVGGLIVGQSAVEAGIVSTIVVIVVALTAIASFAIPNEEFASVFRLLKFFIIFTSAVAGLYGFVLGLLIIAIHLSELTSFGIPYMLPSVGGECVDEYDANIRKRMIKHNQDYVLRAPIKVMRERPLWTKKESRVRFRKKDGD